MSAFPSDNSICDILPFHFVTLKCITKSQSSLAVFIIYRPMT